VVGAAIIVLYWPRGEVRSEEFDRIMPKGTQVERLATGFNFTEGPVWNGQGGYLLFSDIRANRIRKWSPGEGAATFRSPSNNSNGLTYDREGRLIACEHGGRCVSRIDGNGTRTVLADRYQGRRLNSPNDVVVRTDGAIYFTDPPYGVQDAERELTFQGVFRLSPGSGELTLLVSDLVRPNGLALSPDERVLYIADTQRNLVRAYDVNPDGTLGSGRDFAPGVSNPDGMKVDSEGRLYVAAMTGIEVYAPNGKHVGTISVPERPANCGWGDADWKSLYITARTSLYRVRLNATGIAVG